MSGTTPHPDDPADARRPGARFPLAAALFCAACVGMAAWLWMRYSYCWDVTPAQLNARVGHWILGDESPVENHYVRIHGVPEKGPWTIRPGRDACIFVRFNRPDNGCAFDVAFEDGGKVPGTGRVQSVRGRIDAQRRIVLRPGDDRLGLFVVDTMASRFTGESVAGLVVGAMGCLIFTLYLRRWIRERTR
ncbi:MAG: hypothetical protein ACYTKD_00145 [Planctomycetota bacterium]|jgi:hypothetical protein